MIKPLVLVVDDDESVRRYLSSLLTSIGYDVQCLPSGDKAVAALAVSAPPAVVLLDLVMPGMSGLVILQLSFGPGRQADISAANTVFGLTASGDNGPTRHSGWHQSATTQWDATGSGFVSATL